MGYLLFQLSLTLWNNKTNHVILYQLRSGMIDDVLSVKRNVRLVASWKEFYIQNLMNFRSVANAMMQLNMVLGQWNHQKRSIPVCGLLERI